jgi:hypothetical protein
MLFMAAMREIQPDLLLAGPNVAMIFVLGILSSSDSTELAEVYHYEL